MEVHLVKFTVAIPTHNNTIDDLKKSVYSAADVGFDDYEVIISDTSDNEDNYNFVVGLIKEQAWDNVFVFHNDSTWSMWDNHNYLIDRARGDYIFFLHADDVVLKNALTDLDNLLKVFNYPNRMIVAGNSVYKSFKNDIERLQYPVGKLICGSDLVEIFTYGGLTPSGTLFSSDIKNIGGFIADSMILPYTDCWAELNCALNGFRMVITNDIYFIRESNGTKLKYGSDETMRNEYQKLSRFFDYSKSMIIINAALKTNSWLILKYFTFDDRFKKLIYKQSIRRFILHPYKNRRMRRLFYWHA